MAHYRNLNHFFMRHHKTVITGIGIVSPIGIGKDEFWEGLLQGRCGFQPITRYSTENLSVKLAAEVKDWDNRRNDYLTGREIQCYALHTQFAVAAARMAIADAGLNEKEIKTADIVIGTGAEAHQEIVTEVQKTPLMDSEDNINPLVALKTMLFAPAAAISLALKTEGEVLSVSSACTSAFHALSVANDRISTGLKKLIITGGAESPINKIMILALTAAKMLYTGSDVPKSVCPFDLDRSGSGLGEGSAIIILEAKESAQRRGARIYAEIDCIVQGQENQSVVFSSDKSGKRWARIIEKVKDKCKSINAHAPGHGPIDALEVKAMRNAGIRLDDTQICSIKAAFGSGLASAAAFQIASAALSVYHNKTLKTINFHTPDPELQNLTPTMKVEKLRGKSILVNAKALGGSEAALRLSRSVI